MSDFIYGAKLLAADGGSLHGGSRFPRVFYPVGEWTDAPGWGAFVAINGGLIMGGFGPILTIMECDPLDLIINPTAPDGVLCFSRVRRLPDLDFSLLDPVLRGQIGITRELLPLDQMIECMMGAPMWFMEHLLGEAPWWYQLAKGEDMSDEKEVQPDAADRIARLSDRDIAELVRYEVPRGMDPNEIQRHGTITQTLSALIYWIRMHVNEGDCRTEILERVVKLGVDIHAEIERTPRR